MRELWRLVALVVVAMVLAVSFMYVFDIGRSHTWVNRLGIGPAGIGGTVTALDAHIVTRPTHIAGMPVAVNLCCHALRHATEVL